MGQNKIAVTGICHDDLPVFPADNAMVRSSLTGNVQKITALGEGMVTKPKGRLFHKRNGTKFTSGGEARQDRVIRARFQKSLATVNCSGDTVLQ